MAFGNDSTTVVIVFVSFGGLFFFAALAVVLCFVVKKMKKHKRKMVEKTKILDIDEHLKMKEDIVEGKNGAKTVLISVDDDVHVEEEIKWEKEKCSGQDMHANARDGHGESGSGSIHQDIERIA